MPRFDTQAQLQCLGLTVSAPPTQAEVRAIAGQPDEVITTLQGHVGQALKTNFPSTPNRLS